MKYKLPGKKQSKEMKQKLKFHSNFLLQQNSDGLKVSFALSYKLLRSFDPFLYCFCGLLFNDELVCKSTKTP